MFGLEKDKKELFEFDMEKDFRKHPQKLVEMSKSVEGKINAIKSHLRQGAGAQDFENLTFVMQGYSVLLRVLNRIKNKKHKE